MNKSNSTNDGRKSNSSSSNIDDSIKVEKIEVKESSFWRGLDDHQGNKAYKQNAARRSADSDFVMPITSFSMQKFVLYETKTRFYLVGSNRTKNRFRLLKIDRTYEDEVVIAEDPTEYNKQQLQDLLTMIGNANKEGLSRVCSAYGLLGFIRFLHGYYIILITRRRKVGVIGTHIIYGVDDTSYVYIPTSVPKANGPDFADENRYKGLFLGLDLTKDFFYSHTYDITRTMQFNMTRYFHTPTHPTIQRDPKTNQPKLYYNEQFTWNQFLLAPLVEQSQTWHWILPIIHGFFVQEKIDIFGKAIDLILIARRSRYYAGARFLKRGINEDGYVANEVETEQIVQEPLSGDTRQAQFSSYVQVRGSIPLYWEQDNSIMMPKPPIKMQRSDPFYATTILHFQQLMRRYGSPIVILNLVKSNEKKPRESILRNEFTTCVQALNEMLPPSHHIDYCAWDFHQAAKSKDDDHMGWLDQFAQQTLQKTGIFHSSKKLYFTTLREGYQGSESDPALPQSRYIETGCEQIGIARTNCIDSLDRTNSAQFCIGKCALGHQLYALGVMDSTTLDFGSGVVDLLIEMYEACGNQIALQYGGSELANTIKTYTKNSLSSQSRDFVTTIKRYISNSFIDVDKQHSINLFLGYFVPGRAVERIPLWSLETDHYLHNTSPRPQHVLLAHTDWWTQPLADFSKSSLTFSLPSKESIIDLMKTRATAYEFEDNFYKVDTLLWFDQHFQHRFNDPIRFRNQSPLANTSAAAAAWMDMKKKQQLLASSPQPPKPSLTTSTSSLNSSSSSVESVDTDTSNKKNSDSNRYDIKRWVLSLSNSTNKKRAAESIVASVTSNVSSPQGRDQSSPSFYDYQPFEKFGLVLGTDQSEKDIYQHYTTPLQETLGIYESQYRPQDIYNHKYYRSYLKNSYQVECPEPITSNGPNRTAGDDKHFHDITRSDLKSFFYNSYLSQHQQTTLYSVTNINESLYSDSINISKTKNELLK